MKKKKLLPTAEERKKAFVRDREQLELKNRILGNLELFVTDKASDEYLDKLSLIIKLNGGDEFTLEDYIERTTQEYHKHFYRDYYYGIAKLFGYDPSVMDTYIKPECARDFTMQFIYGRFPKKVVDYIMSHTKWSDIPGVREFKLFQKLSPQACEQLDLFIDQAVKMMGEYSEISTFNRAYCSKYKVSCQMDLFKN